MVDCGKLGACWLWSNLGCDRAMNQVSGSGDELKKKEMQTLTTEVL